MSLNRILTRKPVDSMIERAVSAFVKAIEFDMGMAERAPGWRVTPIRVRLIGLRMQLKREKAQTDYVSRLTSIIERVVPNLQRKLDRQKAEQAELAPGIAEELAIRAAERAVEEDREICRGGTIEEKAA